MDSSNPARIPVPRGDGRAIGDGPAAGHVAGGRDGTSGVVRAVSVRIGA